ncbi:MAG: WecB/TagA/CpsF family glycosyltransferase [Treponema sp.]|nr:WecB/TagA/CpsF family glycosyltransferase [Treponema sp.]
MDIERGDNERGDLKSERILFLNVPLDILPRELLSDIILDFKSKRLEKAPFHQSPNIILLSLWDLLKARRNSEYREYVYKAALVIPISKSIISGAKFLTGKKPVRYMPFDFIINVLSILEKREGSLFLLGGSGSVLKKAEKNLRTTFPHLNIVGRSDARNYRKDETAVIQAIRKSLPDMLLAGKGVRGGELWIARNSAELNSGFRLWCSDLFDILADKRKRPTDAVFDKGLEGIGFFLRNPLRILKIFPFMYFGLLLLVYRLFKR